MQSLFSPDSKFMQAMGRLGDLMLLNFFFLVTCVPIFTIGAAATALYTVCFRMGTDRERGALGPYFRAFRANFKQATCLWLPILLCGVCALVDIRLFYGMNGPLHYLFIPFVVLLLIALLTASYLFPLLSQFESDSKQALKNALVLSLGYLPRSILIVLLNSFPFMVLAYDLLIFMQSAFLWVALYFSAVAYLNTLLLKKVFKPYLPEEEEEETK